MLQHFISKLNFRIKEKMSSGFLKADYFTTWNYNYQSEAHSRILSLIVGVGHELGFDVEIERGFNYIQNRIREFFFQFF